MEYFTRAMTPQHEQTYARNKQNHEAIMKRHREQVEKGWIAEDDPVIQDYKKNWDDYEALIKEQRELDEMGAKMFMPLLLITLGIICITLLILAILS